MANLEAIRIVRELDAQQRPATEAEQRSLARWSSWGAVPQLFDKDDWANERAQLRAVLSEREYAPRRGLRPMRTTPMPPW